MLKHSDAILKLALALAILLAGGGVGFYYGIFLPSQDIRRQTQAMAERRSKSEAQSRALVEQARREADLAKRNAERAKAAQREYNDCIGFAELSYKRRWAGSCRTLHDADVAAFEDCADNLFSTDRGCRAKHPIRPANDCALPARMAHELTSARDKRKRECLAKLQAVQAASGGSPTPLSPAER
ncbi:hypothetical protein [Novosphingobium malaysiense]|uniref:Uncharacterized protein n=1 Tax=Novosphingobium malaysiense TaxID=1348853 RepID=A0A0B1ZJY4_9SPHN|nr:hypothetical protein [Novosphingobium malaysiense]KHK89578.1 hypothetical protein LK12_21080 [Novosphingobium malaysiense]